MEKQKIKVYARIKDNVITSISSSIFNPNPTQDDILIDEGYGMKFAHAQGNYLSKPITDEEGLHNYKLVDGKVVERTVEEKDVERASIPIPEHIKTNKELQDDAVAQSQVIDDILLNVIPSMFGLGL